MSPVVGTILMVAITVVLAALLYITVAGLISNPGIGPQSIGLVVESTSGNWSVRIASVPPGKLPNSTFAVIRGLNGSVVLPRTAISDFTMSNWNTFHVLFEDAHPQTPEVAAADRLVIEQATYPRGFVLELSDVGRILAIQTLQ